MKKSPLIVFDSVEAARDLDVQIALLEMAKEDGNIAGIEHALNVISAANQKNRSALKKL
ncbi:hypothetical protein [Acetobacter malorum]|uniref:hypothetical protein n=1 Tax=Acetobacter malorum TaxID=178901 RepID=UPI000AE7FECD|nr:hypothetical protein [Acetobacter malorum]